MLRRPALAQWALFLHDCARDRLANMEYTAARVDEDRSTQGSGGLTPVAFATRLQSKQGTVSPGSQGARYSRRGDVRAAVLLDASPLLFVESQV